MTNRELHIAFAKETYGAVIAIGIMPNNRPEDELPYEQALALGKELKKTRDEIKKDTSPILEHDALRIMRDVVIRAAKEKMGNCAEFALTSLYHFMKIDKKNLARAEKFTINKTEHTAIVIGRVANSDPQNPETWGKDAIICDPYHKIEYMSAQEFFTKIYPEIYPGQIKISISPFFNTDFIRTQIATNNIFEEYLYNVEFLKNRLIDHIEVIKKQINQLESANDKASLPHRDILNKKLISLNAMQKFITRNQKPIRKTLSNDYFERSNTLHTIYNDIVNQVMKGIQFTREETAILATPTKTPSMFSFFAATTVNDNLQKTSQELLHAVDKLIVEPQRMKK